MPHNLKPDIDPAVHEVVRDILGRSDMMTKPHEETWSTRPLPDLTLIAQAPAMAQLLLALQWSGYVKECPSCHSSETLGRHEADCELAAVLRAAGVLP